jgi:uracil-DNA glycosylase
MIDLNTLKVEKCFRCDMCVNRTTIVSGRGPINARIMIIGEAPGALEDRLSIPFVGNSGQLLRNILRKFFIEPKDIYITNVVKCRPPGNRTPTDNEIRNCRPYLLLEIAKVNPKIILVLGSTAYKAISSNPYASVTNDRGRIRTMGNRVILPTYHPSYVLRNKTNVKTVIQFIRDIVLFYKLVRLLP